MREGMVEMQTRYFRQPDGYIREEVWIAGRLVRTSVASVVFVDTSDWPSGYGTGLRLDWIKQRMILNGVVNATLDMTRIPYPWERKPCTALVKEGPKALALYSGGRT